MEVEDFEIPDAIIASLIEDGTVLKSHRRRFKRYRNTVKGTKLVSFLQRKGFGVSPQVCTKLAQRLIDASLLFPCASSSGGTGMLQVPIGQVSQTLSERLATATATAAAAAAAAHTATSHSHNSSSGTSTASASTAPNTSTEHSISPTPSPVHSPRVRASSPSPLGPTLGGAQEHAISRHRPVSHCRTTTTKSRQNAPESKIVEIMSADLAMPFTADDRLYTSDHPFASQLKQMNKGRKYELKMAHTIVEGTLHVRGEQRMLLMYGFFIVDLGVLYLFRHATAPRPLDVILLDGTNAVYSISDTKYDTTSPDHQHHQQAVASAAQQQSTSDSDDAKTRRPIDFYSNSPVFSRFLVTLTSATTWRKWKFMFDSIADRDTWVTAFEQAGVHRTAVSREDDSLPLQDVIDTPLFRSVFAGYLKKQLALENLKFLEAVESYRRVADINERKSIAEKVMEQYIRPSAAELVNLDSHSMDRTVAAFRSGEFRRALFDDAYTCIYAMMNRDVYTRFIQTPEYNDMVLESRNRRTSSVTESKSHSISRFASTSNLSRSHSFVIPGLDDAKMLRSLLTSMEKQGVLQDRRSGITKYALSATSEEIVEFFLQHQCATIRPVAISLGQRMVDAGFLRFAKGPRVFEAGHDKLYTASPDPAVIKYEAAAKLCLKPDIVSGSLLYKGVKYNRVFAIALLKEGKLVLYRSKISKNALRIVELRSMSVEHVQIASAAGFMFGVIEESDEDNDHDNHDDDDDDDGDGDGDYANVDADTPPAIHYLTCDGEIFRIENRDDLQQWTDVAATFHS
jgi:Regulator of G protein signaling domain